MICIKISIKLMLISLISNGIKHAIELDSLQILQVECLDMLRIYLIIKNNYHHINNSTIQDSKNLNLKHCLIMDLNINNKCIRHYLKRCKRLRISLNSNQIILRCNMKQIIKIFQKGKFIATKQQRNINSNILLFFYFII